MKKYFKRIKKEKAAVSALVAITVLTFIAVLLAAFVTVTTLRQSQLKSDMRIQDVYGADVGQVNSIYNEIYELQVQKNSINEIVNEMTNELVNEMVNEI